MFVGKVSFTTRTDGQTKKLPRPRKTYASAVQGSRFKEERNEMTWDLGSSHSIEITPTKNSVIDSSSYNLP